MLFFSIATLEGSTLPGDEEAKPEETIVIGAHRDHFGRQAGLLFAGLGAVTGVALIFLLTLLI